ncbi:MAG: hypothetical protein GY856_36515 [bacterium]|nr:hypothetical protein [bacterium]
MHIPPPELRALGDMPTADHMFVDLDRDGRPDAYIDSANETTDVLPRDVCYSYELTEVPDRVTW